MNSFRSTAEIRNSKRPRHFRHNRRRRSPCDVTSYSHARWRNELTRRLRRCVLRGRQLQHGRVLALTQGMHQGDTPICEFQGIVMHVRPVQINLPEASYGPDRLMLVEERPALIEQDFLFEYDLRAREQANSDVRLAERRKPVRGGTGESGRDQLLADPRGPRHLKV